MFRWSNGKLLGALKAEMLYDLKHDDEKLLRNKLIEYIVFYNNDMLQAKLKGMTP